MPVSQMAYLLCEETKEVLGLGKVLRDEQNFPTRFWYAGVDEQSVRDATYKFLLSHSGKKCVFITDGVLWQMDLDGYVWADPDYGLPFVGLRELNAG